MTRKRFIKLVMSCEYQRNEAERIAALLPLYGSYDELLRRNMNIIRTRLLGRSLVRGMKMAFEARRADKQARPNVSLLSLSADEVAAALRIMKTTEKECAQ